MRPTSMHLDTLVVRSPDGTSTTGCRSTTPASLDEPQLCCRHEERPDVGHSISDLGGRTFEDDRKRPQVGIGGQSPSAVEMRAALALTLEHVEAALIGLAGVLIGVVGGYVTARASARSSAAQSDADRVAARESDRRRMALELARLEVERNPDSPYSPAEYAAVLMHQLRSLDATIDAGEPVDAVDEFRRELCERCGSHLTFDGGSRRGRCVHCDDSPATE